MWPKTRHPYRLVSDRQAEIIRQLYISYSMYELHRYLPISYPTIRDIIRKRGAYADVNTGVPDYDILQEVLEEKFKAGVDVSTHR